MGDIRVSGKSNQDFSVRGVLFELNALNYDGELGSNLSEEDKNTLKLLMEKLCGSSGVKVDNMKMHGRYTERFSPSLEEGNPSTCKQLAGLYIEFFRTMRS